MDTSAIMGFMNSLMDVIKKETRSFAVAFDGGSQLNKISNINAPIPQKR
jgi:hypothetical protein